MSDDPDHGHGHGSVDDYSRGGDHVVLVTTATSVVETSPDYWWKTLSVSKWSRAELTSHLGWSRAESYMDLSRRKEEQKFGGESGNSSTWQTSQQEQTSILEL